jgi:hypothetical protein
VSKLRVVFSVFQEKAELLAEQLDNNLDENGEGVFDSKGNHSVRFQYLLTVLVARLNTKMGLDVAGLTLLGLELKNLNSDDPKYE